MAHIGGVSLTTEHRNSLTYTHKRNVGIIVAEQKRLMAKLPGSTTPAPKTKSPVFRGNMHHTPTMRRGVPRYLQSVGEAHRIPRSSVSDVVPWDDALNVRRPTRRAGRPLAQVGINDMPRGPSMHLKRCLLAHQHQSPGDIMQNDTRIRSPDRDGEPADNPADVSAPVPMLCR